MLLRLASLLPPILKNIKKGITLEQSRAFARHTKMLGLKVFGCFIVGLTGETRDTIEDTFQFARETDADMVFFQQAVPFPGTDFFRTCKAEGLLHTHDYKDWMNSQGQLACLVDYPEFSHQELEIIRDRLMSRFYFSFGYIFKTFFSNPNLKEIRRISKAGMGYLQFRLRHTFRSRR